MVFLCGLNVAAQDIMGYYYWFDTADDAKVFVAQTANTIVAELDASALASGIHRLTIVPVAKDSTYSPGFSRYFYHSGVSGECSYEYWIDEDYAGRVSGAAADDGMIDLEIDATALQPGIHRLNFAAKAGDETVSGFSRYFYHSGVTGECSYEYWIDEDYAGRVSGAAADGGVIDLEIDATGLQPGIHRLNFAAKAGDETVSGFSRYFYHTGVLGECSYEYWFDDDDTRRVSGTMTDGTVDLTLATDNLRRGLHTLTFAVKAGKETVSAFRRYFYKPMMENEDRITAYAYGIRGARMDTVEVEPTQNFVLKNLTVDFPDSMMAPIVRMETGTTVGFYAHEGYIDDGEETPVPRLLFARKRKTEFYFAYRTGAAEWDTDTCEVEAKRTMIVPAKDMTLNKACHIDGNESDSLFVRKIDLPAAGVVIKADTLVRITVLGPDYKVVKTFGGKEVMDGVTFEVPEEGTYYLVCDGLATDEGPQGIDVELLCLTRPLPKPQISYEDGKVSIGSEVEGTTIYYTLNGPLPTTDSKIYTEPFAVTGRDSVVVRAMAVYGQLSRSMTGRYVVHGYRLAYVVDGETVHADTLLYGTPVKALADPTMPGRTFSGWTGVPDVMPAHDVVVYGSFAANVYKIVFVVEGERTDSVMCAYGVSPREMADAMAKPEKEGYTFEGWQGVPDAMPAHEVVVTARFKVNRYELVYVLDDAVYQKDSVAYGTAITPPDVPAKEGSIFSGWADVPDVMPAHDVRISGRFLTNSYKIYFVVEGVRTDSVICAYGTPVREIVNSAQRPVKEGYAFTGWQGVPDAMPAHDIEVRAEFSTNAYKIVFVTDGERTDSVMCVYGTSAAEAAKAVNAPSKPYYDFKGWAGLPEVMPAEDVTADAVFELRRPVYDDGVEKLVLNGYLLDEQEQERIRGLKHLRVLDISRSRTMAGGVWNVLPDGAFSGIATLEEVYLCRTTERVGEGILKGCPNLLEVYWNTTRAVEQNVFGDDEPVLLYVPEGTSVYRTDNVVAGTTAENLVLDARRGFRCHTPFTARKARYSRTFGKETHVGTAAGWETLALPFDVQRIEGTNVPGRQLELYPFQEGKGMEGDGDFGTRYGLFWLAGLQADGWKAVTEMKADMPYIIAMPNGNDYEEEFCISGNVTFSAENVEVRAVPQPTAGMGFAMRPVYERVAQADTVYALNNETWRDTYWPGSVFVRGGRGVEPFECYLKGMTAAAQAKRYVAIGMNDGIDGIRHMLKDRGNGLRVWTDESGLNVMAGKDCLTGIYSVDGRLLAPLRLKAGQKVTKRLVPGVYIVGKQKITVH